MVTEVGARSGIIGLVALVLLFYFSGIGPIMLQKAQAMEGGCYSTMARAGDKVARAVCNGVSAAVQGMNRLAETFEARTGWIGERLKPGSGSREGLSDMMASLREKLGGLSSSGDRLTQLMQGGSSQLGRSITEPFQQAIDSFSIGQHYMQSGSTKEAMPWLQQGADQPGGYGLLSQITLGDFYRRGGSGIAADPQRAQAYLQQASQSLSTLMGSHSPQSQQLLGSLPVAPGQMQMKLQQALQQLKLHR